jgi:nitrogen regulatory protein PII
MKLVEGTIDTRDMAKLSNALEAMGLIVLEIIYDGRRTVNYGIIEGIACVYNLINRVKIRTIVSDERVGAMMDTLHGFGNCKFIIIPEERFCPA